MQRPTFVPCTYAGKPAVFDTVARVFYTCATHTRADCFDALTDNGKAIYRELETRYGFAHG